MNFTPLGDNVLVKTLSRPDQTAAGLYIPSVGTDGTVVEGVVMSVGPGRVLQTGVVTETPLKAGDKVWFPKFNATEVEVDGEKAFVVSETYLLGYRAV